jgi:asparagine synthase (glutamine-hydrolysing)
MADQIIHRGPDGAGVWLSELGQVGLGHRRLSIVDLSLAGHQPMHSPSGRYVLSFNGEIYNHIEIRDILEDASLRQPGLDRRTRTSVLDCLVEHPPTGHAITSSGDSGLVETCWNWRGHSDTETLLAGFDAWGIEPTIRRTVGMFAVAIWDRQLQSLTLVRDRLGEKPLYYGWLGDVFVFSSELKSLKAHPLWRGEIDRTALELYLRFNYIPAPHSIYQGIGKLMPGTLLTIGRSSKVLQAKQYWSARDAASFGVQHPYQGDERDAVLALDGLLRRAIGQQMMSDVPLGALLSGGVDSSTVAAMMQAQSRQPIKTFTIGFSEEGYDEAVYARAVARHLGTDHSELYVSAAQAIDTIPQLPILYDEPFADSSQIPTFLVSRLAKASVSVTLSGDAGDELFCGYNRYVISDQRLSKIGRIPLPIRKIVAKAIRHFSPNSFNSRSNFLPSSLNRYTQFGDKLHKVALLLDGNLEDVYASLVSVWPKTSHLVKGGEEPSSDQLDHAFAGSSLSNIEQMMLLDTLTYLPDDILVKVDRAAMGVSLETRVPFLDHRVVEFAWQIPLSMKLRNGTSKWVLREVLYRYVPKELIDRPKMGFGIPLDSWLRGPLRDWGESLLDASRLEREGYFHPDPIRRKWEQHLSGKYDFSYQLWGILMFQSWLDSNK